MGRGHRTCEVCGVKERHSGEKLLFSHFPLDPNRCREWLKAVGNEDLVHLPIEKLHDQRSVCGNHFQRKDFNKKGNRLKRHAIPTLNLMAIPLTDSHFAEFPLHVWTNQVSVPMEEPTTSQVGSQILYQDVSVPMEVPTTSQKGSQILSQTVSVPMEVPSTSRKGSQILSQTVSVPMEVPTTSRKGSQILSQTVSVPMEVPSTSRKGSQILSQTVSVPMEVPSTSRKGSQILSQTVSVPMEVPSTSRKGSQILSQTELTPRKKKLMERLRKTKCSLASLAKSAKLIDKLESPVLKEIVTSAITNQKRKPKGRRWTTQNKISALAIFKRSPKAYRYLQHLMPLPTVKTLNNVLKKIPMEPGVNKAVLEHLEKISSKKNDLDKYCALVFDEIALKRRLLYDVASDKVQGYEDMGSGKLGRSPQLADHALVFLLQGLRAKFKQPLAFYFVKGTVSSQRLAFLIKEIIRAVRKTGYKIMTTICDQGPTNMGALKILKTLCPPPHDEKQNYFECDNETVYIIFDVPHLFKSFRNNFQNYGELYMNEMKANWSHLLKVEEKNRELLYLSKITPIHVQPKYRAKMKVKYAAQILSNTVAAVLKLLAQAENDPIIADEILQTGIIVHDLDRLFDKTNGPSCPDDVKKGRRENVSSKTDHVNVWAEYRLKLESVKFKNANGTKAKNVRCIEGYLITLRFLRDIWSEVSALGFKYLNLRQLNQDALENLFGVIRQHSPTNRNPTCYTFIAALKTTIISGMTAPHNRGSNCEKDSKILLTDFHNLVFENSENKDSKGNELKALEQGQSVAAEQQEIPILSIPEEFEEIATNLAEMEQQPIVYVSGYIASSIFKKHKCRNCAMCLKLDNPEADPVFSYIQLREWWSDKHSLTYPTKHLCRLVEAAIKIFESEVLPNIHYLDINKLTVTLFMAKCDASFITCKEHRDEIIDIIYGRLSLLLIRRQCQRVNQNLALQEESSADANKKAQQQGIAK